MNVAELRAAAGAYRLSQAIYAFAELRIPDALAGGPRSAGDVARTLRLHEPYLARLLRALSSEGVLEETGDGRFALTTASRELAGPGGLGDMLRGWSVFPPTYAAFGHLAQAIREGRPPFELAHGTDFHGFLRSSPPAAAAYGAATDSTLDAFDETVRQYDFSRFATVVDVGGGGGAFLVALLRAHPSMRGVCVDLAHVIENARLSGMPADVADRLELCAADVFVDALPAADAYTLITVVRLFEDDAAVRLLRAIRAAMSPDATVVIEDFWLPDGPTPSPLGLSDLQALCAYGGRDRTRAEYDAVLERSGFRLGHVHPLDGGPFAIFEALPV